MTARENQSWSAQTALTVELSIEDAELEERVRTMLTEPGLEVVDADAARVPHIQITDGTVGLARGVPVLVLTDASGAMEALQTGAAAVLSESTDGQALCAAIRAVAQGLTTLSRQFRERLVDDRDARDGLADDAEDEPPAIDLTARELQVLRLLMEGASNKTIARRLDITPHTAKFHVASIVAKLGATGRTEAVAKAMRLGVIMA